MIIVQWVFSFSDFLANMVGQLFSFLTTFIVKARSLFIKFFVDSIMAQEGGNIFLIVLGLSLSVLFIKLCWYYILIAGGIFFIGLPVLAYTMKFVLLILIGIAVYGLIRSVISFMRMNKTKIIHTK